MTPQRAFARIREGSPFAYDFTYRPNTSDEKVLEAVFGRMEYNLGRLNRIGEITQLHANIKSQAKKPLILDLGANIGAVANFYNDVFPGSEIVCVEPHSETCVILTQNIAHFGGDAIHAGVASEDGRLKLTTPQDGEYWACRTETSEEGDFKAISVPTILDDHRDAVPFLVKIDIEGAEAELFSKNTDWIKLFPILIIELHDWLLPKQATSVNFRKVSSELDVDFIVFGENLVLIRHQLG